MNKVKGAANASDIYTAVGVALSYWEGAQDAIIGLYRILHPSDTAAVAAFLKGSRAKRADLLTKSINKQDNKFTENEIKKILICMEKICALVEMRNKIAHGHCSKSRSSIQGVLKIDGYVLSPAFNRGEWVERNLSLSMDDREIIDFAYTIRGIRAELIDLHEGAFLRLQNVGNAYQFD